MWKKALLALLMTASMTGCTVGLKERKTILMVSPVPIPEAVLGTPLIATNEEIPLVVLNRPDDHYEQKITGYVVVDPWFYEKLIAAWNASRKAP